MNIIQNLFFLLLFAAFVALMIFMAGGFLLIGLLLLPITLIGGMKIKKSNSQKNAPQKKTIDGDFSRVE